MPVLPAITAGIPGINRCVWNLAPRVPAGAHAVHGTVTRERLDLLREADHIVMQVGPEGGAAKGLDNGPAQLVVLAGQGDRRGQAPGHLDREGRS